MGTIYIFQNTGNTLQLITQINAHDGLITKVDFSHPRFGSLLGSAGFDGKICIWKEINETSYECVYEYKEEEKGTSMNYITFSKLNNELLFVSGGLDGNIILHSYTNDKFCSNKIFAHDFGVNSINFNQNDPNIFVSCGNDSLIKIWNFNKQNLSWEISATIDETDCVVNDVLFKNGESFVSGGEDGVLMLFTKVESEWKKKEIAAFEKSISQLSWDENRTKLMVILVDGEKHLIEEESFNENSEKHEN